MRKATVFTIIICLLVLFPLTINSQPPPPRKKVTVQKPSFTLGFPDKDINFNRVSAMAFTPAGQLLTVNTYAPLTCVLWDVSNGKALRNFTLHSTAGWDVLEAFFSPNFQFLAVAVMRPSNKTAVFAERLQFWDMVTEKHISNFTAPVYWRGFSPDGKRFVSKIALDNSGKAWTIAFWETTGGSGTGTYIRTLDDRQEGYRPPLIFSPDGKFLATVPGKLMSSADVIDVWDTHTGKKIRTFRPSLNGFYGLWIRDLVVSPDGRGLAVSAHRINNNGGNYAIELWDWSGKLRHRLKLPSKQHPANIVFSPDGRMIASTITADSAGYQNIVHLWDADTGEYIRALSSVSGYIFNAVFSPDGQRLVCNATSDRAPLWNPHTGKIIALLSHGGEGELGISNMIFSPDGEIIAATVDASGALIVWKIASDRDQGRYR
jgi:WD40 repeat protein